ncbi:MAG: Trp family transcriptional regulator [Chitinispirillia bacterium]|jgi:TrpR family trp operon transcriptional repressor
MREIQELAEVFSEITDINKMIKFFDEIFTESERKTLILRWKLMKMLNNKVPQRSIASKLGISLCKITRGAKIVKDQNSICRALLNK